MDSVWIFSPWSSFVVCFPAGPCLFTLCKFVVEISAEDCPVAAVTVPYLVDVCTSCGVFFVLLVFRCVAESSYVEKLDGFT